MGFKKLPYEWETISERFLAGILLLLPDPTKAEDIGQLAILKGQARKLLEDTAPAPE